jgi:hypothetical protein
VIFPLAAFTSTYRDPSTPTFCAKNLDPVLAEGARPK